MNDPLTDRLTDRTSATQPLPSITPEKAGAQLGDLTEAMNLLQGFYEQAWFSFVMDPTLERVPAVSVLIGAQRHIMETIDGLLVQVLLSGANA